MCISNVPQSAASKASIPLLAFFAGIMFFIMLGACLLAGWAPLGFSIVIVFLFAGPHNWFELRYFLSKMPARWGKLWPYYSLGISGVVLLTVAEILMFSTFRNYHLGGQVWRFGIALWNSMFIVWVISLTLIRSRQNPKRLHWDYIIPVGLLLISATWIWPLAWSLCLVYLHPLVALVFFDRELEKQSRDLQIVYRWCLSLLPLLLFILWWRLAFTPNLHGEDELSLQITQHVGGGVFQGLSTHLLVSTHAFLEMLHYAVWVFAFPLVIMRSNPWKLTEIPLAKKSVSWRGVITVLVAGSAILVIVMWAGFLGNYSLTREIYFTLALAHVLAEVPFLLRLL